MKLMTKEIEKTLPALYTTESTPTHEKVALLKIFDPCGRMTYYATEYDPEERIFFGYMVSPLGPDCDEWGNSSLDEFEAVKGPLGLGLERDLYFTPTKLGALFPHMVPAESSSDVPEVATDAGTAAALDELQKALAAFNA